jgi:exportin-2 (importin alpha re-exporter)
VKFLQAFLSKGPEEIVARGHLTPLLGVAHKLISSKSNDVYGFELLISIIENIPLNHLSSYVKNIFVLLLTRLTSSKTSQFSHGFLCFMCTLFVIQKPGFTVDDIIGTLDSIQATPLFNGLLSGVLLPELKNIYSSDDLNLCLIGMAHLLTKSQMMLSPTYLSMWPSILESLMALVNHPLPPASAPDEDGEFHELDESGYQVSFSRLSTVGPAKKSVYLGVTTDSKMYLGN